MSARRLVLLCTVFSKAQFFCKATMRAHAMHSRLQMLLMQADDTCDCKPVYTLIILHCHLHLCCRAHTSAYLLHYINHCVTHSALGKALVSSMATQGSAARNADGTKSKVHMSLQLCIRV
jgi:hypothetical protein